VTYELILLDVQESLYGTYTCHIVNMKGTGMNSITLESESATEVYIDLVHTKTVVSQLPSFSVLLNFQM